MTEIRARVTFTPTDIRDHFLEHNIELTFDEADAWLVEHRKEIEDAMAREGWAAIETLTR
jgi:hypothetical protein